MKDDAMLTRLKIIFKKNLFVLVAAIAALFLLFDAYAVAATSGDVLSFEIWNWNRPLFFTAMVILVLLTLCVKLLVSVYKLSAKLRETDVAENRDDVKEE